ncbi:MAG: Stp1/IreP family PP2C-type Ser/Thr phosphatase [Blautia sp.]|nr:Stp1/IreP family PP2C-type Ser/Thr phosphatase [Muribaculaceae bacterium]MCM1143809.1 Stp1/IreP family PP2C-type Ser/Thr phosphatase [Lachnoclostridium sp.]MCM1210472.1 Stp1/IreP family PP2C-type Ser/Thr phosphatase [Blautia sp.]
MLRSYAITDIGRRRKLNQDYIYLSETPVGRLPNLFIVADGMGGHNAGDFASRYAVERIIEEITGSLEEDPAALLREAVQKANVDTRQKANEDIALMGMGTTVVIATCIGNCLKVANVGDSRLYLVNENIEQITVDHSLVEEMVRMGGIDREAARNHPDKNIITRAIGARDTVDVDLFSVECKSGDIVLLCSDGLTNMMEDKTIRHILKQEGSLKEKAEELVRMANDNGGKDNISVIIIEPLAGEVEHD